LSHDFQVLKLCAFDGKRALKTQAASVQARAPDHEQYENDDDCHGRTNRTGNLNPWAETSGASCLILPGFVAPMKMKARAVSDAEDLGHNL